MSDESGTKARDFTRVLVPSGVLGLGFERDALARAMALRPDIIAIDGGSTDSGPHFLGTARSKYAEAVCRAEWRDLMEARAALDIPLVIGSCGTCGADSQVDAMLDLTRELSAELGQTLRVAVLYSGQSVDTLIEAHDRGEITPLNPDTPLDADTLRACTNIVALAGVEQIQMALDTGADIVLAGRATDTALIAAFPLAQGRHAGAAWHAAKVSECGALCSTHPTSGVVVVDIDNHGFEIVATAEKACCTPRTVAAHMLYENADPFLLHEPGGRLNVTNASYAAVDERRVRVEGAEWQPDQRYTVKLEGARPDGFQTSLLVMLRDPRYVAQAREWTERVAARLDDSVASRLRLTPDQWTLELRLIGVDAVLGELETETSTPHEIGVLALVTADTQATANEIARLADPLLLHCPLTDDEPLPTFAFPYSPASTERGQQYTFCLDHVLALDAPSSAFRLVVHELGAASAGKDDRATIGSTGSTGDTGSMGSTGHTGSPGSTSGTSGTSSTSATEYAENSGNASGKSLQSSAP